MRRFILQIQLFPLFLFKMANLSKSNKFGSRFDCQKNNKIFFYILHLFQMLKAKIIGFLKKCLNAQLFLKMEDQYILNIKKIKYSGSINDLHVLVKWYSKILIKQEIIHSQSFSHL